jgi:hypothetical protein
VFYHHIYEYQKGIRKLILHTTLKANRMSIEEMLGKKNISSLIYSLSNHKINVFFGDVACVEVIRQFNKCKLSELTDEEDFILGIMLGYDTAKQCERYLIRKRRITLAQRAA